MKQKREKQKERKREGREEGRKNELEEKKLVKGLVVNTEVRLAKKKNFIIYFAWVKRLHSSF